MVSHWRQTIKGRRWQSQWRGDCELIERFLFASTESWQKVPAWTLIIGSWSHCPRRTISPPYVGHFSKNKNDKDNLKTSSCINLARGLFKRHTDWMKHTALGIQHLSFPATSVEEIFCASKILANVSAALCKRATSKGTPQGAGYATKHTLTTPPYPMEPPNWSLN